MKEPSPSSLWAINLLSFFLFGVLTLAIAFNSRRIPGLAEFLPLLLIVTGPPLLIYGLGTGERYKGVFDYEPARFWKKERTGKEIREILGAFTTVGLWCSLAGVALLILVWF